MQPFLASHECLPSPSDSSYIKQKLIFALSSEFGVQDGSRKQEPYHEKLFAVQFMSPCDKCYNLQQSGIRFLDSLEISHPDVWFFARSNKGERRLEWSSFFGTFAPFLESLLVMFSRLVYL